jgi:NADH dehydrogenase FAD-containing subunit
MHACLCFRVSLPLQPRKVVVVIGGGYGGIAAAKALDAVPGVFVILIDRKVL